MGSKTGRKITIELSASLAEHLSWLAQSQEISQAEAIRKAIANESFFRQEVTDKGQILIEKGGSVKHIVLR